MEHIRPHELAAELANTNYDVVDGRVASARLGNLIVRAQGVWRELIDARFAQDEHGHIGLELTDSHSNHQEAYDYIDSITAVHHDARGRSVPLGGISRLHPDSDKATAFLSRQEGTEPLLPDDPRWDAVVGSIERAIDTGWDGKKARNRARWDHL